MTGGPEAPEPTGRAPFGAEPSLRLPTTRAAASMLTVLVLYDAQGPHIEQLAAAIRQGAGQVPGVESALRPISDARQADLLNADALVLGSPNWSGVTGQMKLWLDEQGDLWEDGRLRDRVGAAFTTGRGRHSGLEITLWQLLHWMLACGLVVVGLPWSQRMRQSGSYYGATATGEVTEDDLIQARDLGQRVAQVAGRLTQPEVRRPPASGI